MKLLILLSFLFISLPTFAMDLCKDNLETFSKLPIQQNGRVKPLLVHSDEVISYLLGKKSYQGKSSLEIFCLLSMQKELNLPVNIEHLSIRKQLGLTNKQTYLYKDLDLVSADFRMALAKIKKKSGLKKAYQKHLNQLDLYKNIQTGQNWLLPVVLNNQTVDWVAFKEFQEQFPLPAQILHALDKSQNLYSDLKGKLHIHELYYYKAKFPVISIITTLLALCFLTLFKKPSLGLALAIVTFVIEFIFIALRVYISGRAPITNMYETVLFSGFGALFLSLVVGHLKKDLLFVYLGLMYNFCTLLMLNFATGMLSASIGPLVPVLRDNFWLSTHVTTIIMSYGALALSWVLANHVLIKSYVSKKGFEKGELNYYSQLIYSCLKYGTVLLAAGILLGGVWADYSWGRFWGWDPKETWSLIVLCVYMIILHGRYTNWINNQVFIPFCSLAFLSVMMAWFGVNYILAEGLHSYGFSQGGAVFLGSFFAIQILIVGLTYSKFGKLCLAK